MQYITTTPLHKNTKKSSLALFYTFLKSSDFEGYIYIKQNGINNCCKWTSIDYINILKTARALSKPTFKPISQAKWWLYHRVNCFKKGIRFSLNESINFK